jgi:hypothetical protein
MAICVTETRSSMDVSLQSRGHHLRARVEQRRSAYELRLNPPGNPQGMITEVFDDAMWAFQRHAAIERILIDEGWMLEGFESVIGATLALA